MTWQAYRCSWAQVDDFVNFPDFSLIHSLWQENTAQESNGLLCVKFHFILFVQDIKAWLNFTVLLPQRRQIPALAKKSRVMCNDKACELFGHKIPYFPFENEDFSSWIISPSQTKWKKLLARKTIAIILRKWNQSSCLENPSLWLTVTFRPWVRYFTTEVKIVSFDFRQKRNNADIWTVDVFLICMWLTSHIEKNQLC